MGILDVFRRPRLRTVPAKSAPARPPLLAVSQLEPYRFQWQTGSKFDGGYGPTNFLLADYWTLRARSAELFETNLYARGLIRRFITNIINTGLHLEAMPSERILGYPEDGLAEWTEDVETRFEIWADNPYLCDFNECHSFGALQRWALQEALVVGDVLVVLRQDQRTRLPRIQLINGECVQTPANVQIAKGHRIVHGVELNAQRRQVAYWVRQEDGTSKRLPAYGEKSGRRIAWLVYGTDRRLNDVRGKPLLSLVLQSLKEIDRYRDSTQRKAVVNSMLAGFVKKTAPTMGSASITGGAVRRTLATTIDTTGAPRQFKVAEHIPGVFIEELSEGEEIVPLQAHGTDEKFGSFEEAIVQAIAWAHEVPPEILRLSFSSNYSASQAAVNEFKMFLNKARTEFGDAFCEPVYQEWLLAEVLMQRIDAPGFLDAWNDPLRYAELGAWYASEWTGQIKPAVDLSKLVRGYERMISQGLITRDRAARELTGMKFSRIVRQLARENVAIADANKPIVELDMAPVSETESDTDRDTDDEEPEARARDSEDTGGRIVPLRR